MSFREKITQKEMLFKAESDRATNRNYTVDSILPHAEFGPNDYREGAPPVYSSDFFHFILHIVEKDESNI